MDDEQTELTENDTFQTRRELLWYLKGFSDAKDGMIQMKIMDKINLKRFLSSLTSKKKCISEDELYD